VDAKTGKSVMAFGTNGVVDLRVGIDGRDPASIGNIQSNTPGGIFENTIILGSATGEGYMSPPGDIRAYDIVTGKLVWTFHTVPRPGEFGYETWPKDAWKYIGGTNNWGEMTIDTPAGSPTFRSDRRRTTFMASIGSAPTCSARRSSPSTRAPASGCGTSRWCTMTSGTSTTMPRRN